MVDTPSGAPDEPYPGAGSPASSGRSPQGWSGPPLATWAQRASGALIDYVIPSFVAALIWTVNRPLGLIANLGVLGWIVYQMVQQGKTGQSIGKRQAGIKLVSEATGQPIGAAMSVGRYFLHLIDSLACYIGWLFPLWDTKRQTFADKILRTVVVVA